MACDGHPPRTHNPNRQEIDMNLLTRAVPVRKPNVHLRHMVIGLVSGLVVSVIMSFGIRLGYQMGRRHADMAPSVSLGSLMGTVESQTAAEPDLRKGKEVVHHGVTSVFLRNLGGSMRTFSFERPTTVIRRSCRGSGPFECVQWTTPYGTVEREVVWDMDVVSFAYGR